jgi:hypothetical protein
MTYVPSWERLFDALRRVAVGVSVDEAKVAISCAITDRKIQIRITVGPHADLVRLNQMVLNPSPALERFEGANIHVPSHLSPHNLDWPNSRPLEPWQIRPRQSRSARPFLWPNRTVFLIEVRADDVTRLIDEITKSVHGPIASEITLSAPSHHAASQSTPSMSRGTAAHDGASSLERDDAPAPTRKKSQTARERARRVINELYPGGVPDQATLPNKSLCESGSDRRVSAFIAMPVILGRGNCTRSKSSPALDNS